MSASFIQYSQSAGTYDLIAEGVPPLRIGVGWAGCGKGKNNPAMQATPSVGPLPRGRYSIGAPFTHPHVGPYAMRLTPLPGTEMFGRDGFLIHGPSICAANRGQESHGCCILEHDKRVALWNTGARILEVIK
jgi:hypothetical protein